MDKATLTALQGSIAKWEGIVAGTMTDERDENCPLCHVFKQNHCIGCPVRARSGRINCNDTPYVGCILAEDEYGGESEEYRKAAQAELDFLRSLLPASLIAEHGEAKS